MAATNRFAPELTAEEITTLIDNATPGSTKKATKYGMKIFNGAYEFHFAAKFLTRVVYLHVAIA